MTVYYEVKSMNSKPMMKSEYGFIVVFSESQSVEVRYTGKMRNGLQRANRNGSAGVWATVLSTS